MPGLKSFAAKPGALASGTTLLKDWGENIHLLNPANQSCADIPAGETSQPMDFGLVHSGSRGLDGGSFDTHISMYHHVFEQHLIAGQLGGNLEDHCESSCVQSLEHRLRSSDPSWNTSQRPLTRRLFEGFGSSWWKLHMCLIPKVKTSMIECSIISIY